MYHHLYLLRLRCIAEVFGQPVNTNIRYYLPNRYETQIIYI